jgi:hypothetical protein
MVWLRVLQSVASNCQCYQLNKKQSKLISCCLGYAEHVWSALKRHARTINQLNVALNALQNSVTCATKRDNSGLRFIAKICLNSLWGKFGQNPKVKHSEYIDSEKDFYRVILDDQIENIGLCFLNDNMVYASYEKKEEFLNVSYNNNIFINLSLS